jgi:hypothetical protein
MMSAPIGCCYNGMDGSRLIQSPKHLEPLFHMAPTIPSRQDRKVPTDRCSCCDV